MGATSQISAVMFSAFLKCPTKAHILAIGEPAAGAFFVDIEARISYMYKAVAKRQLHAGTKELELLEFGQPWYSLDYGTVTHYVDCDTVVYDFAPPQDRNAGPQPQKSSASETLSLSGSYPGTSRTLPTTCSFVFGALALSQATGILEDTGTMIYGDGYRHRTVGLRTTLSGRARSLRQSGLLGAAGSRHRLSWSRPEPRQNRFQDFPGGLPLEPLALPLRCRERHVFRLQDP
jgi:hypothetical protein